MIKIDPHSPTWFKMVQHGPKWSTILPNCQHFSKIAQNGPKLSKKNSKLFKMVQMFHNSLNGPKSSEIVQNSSKWSKVDSKWVRHNQVPWSSFNRQRNSKALVPWSLRILTSPSPLSQLTNDRLLHFLVSLCLLSNGSYHSPEKWAEYLSRNLKCFKELFTRDEKTYNRAVND